MDLSDLSDSINALAYHFRYSGLESAKRHGALSIPLSMQGSLDERFNLSKGEIGNGIKAHYNPKEIKGLIGSISEEDFERWCLLDTTAFVFVTRILLRAEPCLAKDQGFFRLIEALETFGDEDNGLAMAKELLIDYKDTVGEFLAAELLCYFIDTKESGFSRRWAGLLLVELLQESQVNRKRVWKMPGETFKDIGRVIIGGADRMLKIVAGKIIWQMMQEFKNEEDIRHQLPVFCQSSEADDFIKDFPLKHGSQWESGFASFITEMELNRYDLDLGLPTGYTGLQVKLGNNNPISPDTGAISISITEIFSIYIPPNRDRSPDWIDFKITNISRIEFTRQVIADDPLNDLVYFKLHLCDYDEDGYLYMLSMRPSSDSNNVTILCYKSEVDDFAEDVERCRDEVLQRKGNREPMGAPMEDIQANPARIQSQKEKLSELERHREDILKVLGSPLRSDSYASSVTDPDEGTEDVGLPVLGGEKRREARGKPKPITLSGPLQNIAEMSGVVMGVGGLVPCSSPPVPPAAGCRPEDTPEMVLRGSSPYLRSSIQVQHLKQVTEPLDDMPSSGEDFEEVFRILKHKEVTKVKKNSAEHQPTLANGLGREIPTVGETGEQEKVPKPKIPEVSEALAALEGKQIERPWSVISHATEASDNSLGNILAIGKPTESKADTTRPFDIPSVGNLGTSLEEGLRPPLSRVKKTRMSVEPKQGTKETTRDSSNAIENLEEFHTPPNSYRTKNRAKEKRNLKERITNKNDPSNKMNNVQTTTTNPNTISKAHAGVVKPGRIKLVSPEDTSIWDLPESEESEVERKIPAKKRKGRPKITPQKETPAKKVKQTAKQKLPHKKQVYGKRPVAKPEPKPGEVILDSDEETEPVQEVKLLDHHPTSKQKENPRPKHQVTQKFAPVKSTAAQGSKDEEAGLENKSVYSLRSRMKPKPKPKTAPASVFGKRTLVPDNKDEEIKPLEEENLPILESTPKPIPTPMPKPKPKQKTPKIMQAKNMAAQNKEDEELSSQRPKSKIVWKNIPVPASAKRMAAHESGDELLESREEKKPPTYPPKEKEILEAAPVSIITKRVVSQDNEISRSGDIGPPSKRKKPEPKVAAKTGASPPRQQVRGVPKKRPRLGSFLNTSEADDDSSWRPKTRSRAKVELVSKTTGKRKIIEEQGLDKLREIALERESSEGLPGKAKGTGYLPGAKWRKMAQRSSSLSSESSEILVKGNSVGTSKSGTHLLEYQTLATPTFQTSTMVNHHKLLESQTPGSNHIYQEGKNIDLIPGGNLPSNPKGVGSAAAPHLAQLDTANLSQTGKRVILYDSTRESISGLHNPQVIAETAGFHPDDEIYIVEESNLGGSSKRMVPLPMDHGGSAKGNPAPTVAMDLEAPSPHNMAGGPPNPPSDHPQNPNPLQEQKRNMFLPLTVPGEMVTDPRTPQVRPQVLVDDYLARKAQIISWSNKGPKNQGRAPALDTVHADKSLAQDGFPASESGAPLPTTARALGLFIFASDDEDRVMAWGKGGPNQSTIRPVRWGTETVVDKNGSPLLAPMHQELNEPVEHPEIDKGGGEQAEGRGIVDLNTADDAEKLDYLRPVITYLEEDSDGIPVRAGSAIESSPTNCVDFQGTNYASIGLGVGDISSSDDQGLSSTNKLKEFKRSLVGGETPSVISEDAPEGLKGHTHRKISIIEILESDDSGNEQIGKPVQHDYFKHSAIHNQKPDRVFTMRKPLAAKENQQALKSFLVAKKSLPAPSNYTIPDEKGLPVFKHILSEPREVSPVIDDLLSGVSIGEKYPETAFFKWFQGSRLDKMGNDNYDNCNTSHGLDKGLQSRDSDKTLVNESNYDDSGIGRGLTGNPQEQKQNQGQISGRYILGSDSDNSDCSTDDYEDSGTNDEYEEDGELSGDETDPNLAWRQSLPDYHKETLDVLDQISRGLLRYLMSGEELAMEVIKEFEIQGNEILKQLGDSHKSEYDQFLTKLEWGKEKVQEAHAKAMELIEDDLAEVRKEGEVLLDMKENIGERYRALGDAISALMASLEEDIGGTIL